MNAAVGAPICAAMRPEEIAARSGSNFLAGFVCLGAERRRGMTAIYAFCRVVDDAVDDAPDAPTGRAHLRFWRDELTAAAAGTAQTPVGIELQRTMQRFAVAREPLDALLDGVAMDLEHRGIADDAELHLYCARVASAVGRACLPVLGAHGPDAIAFADHLGQALQLTNILRDLRSDAEAGRVYVPRTWLAELGVSVETLRAAPRDGVAPGLAVLCRRLGDGARAEFAAARRHLAALPLAARRGLVPARIMGAVYRELLERLERRGPDLASSRVRVPKPKKLLLALSVWLGARS